MTRFTSTSPNPAGALSSTVAWATSYPLVATLWHELFNEFIDTCRSELHHMREPGPRWREKQKAASRQNSATQTRAQDFGKEFRIGAPGMSPLPGLVRARPARPSGRPHSHLENHE